MTGTIAGFRLTGRSRAGELGTWYDAVSPDGTPVGMLRFDPRLLAAPGATGRVVAAVTADRRLQQDSVGGLLPVIDLVTARGEMWLITGRPGMPAVTDLLVDRPGAPMPDAGSAAMVLVDTAQALIAVHAAGLAHGSLHSGTIVIGRDGTAVLTERGIAAAVRGHAAIPARDVAAWASLALELSSGWARLAAADLFHRAALTASAQGLEAARDTLIAGREALPRGFATRDRLIETIHWWSAAQAPTGAAGASAGGVTSGMDVPGAGSDEAVTLLDAPGAVAGESTTPPDPPPTGDVIMRFGPGVPPETTAAQIWRAGRDQQPTLPVRDRPRPRWQGRRAGWSTALFALTITAVILAWLLIPRGGVGDLAITGVEVRGPSKTVGCDQTAGFIGVITTNGSAGEVHYQWRQSDGHVNNEQVQTVLDGQRSTRVPLKWNVTGPGTRKFTATLRVLSPVTSGEPRQAKATFTYKC
ncbi:MAG TPA: hypothetical protein VIR33_10445 [Thermopolyspora sp.]